MTDSVRAIPTGRAATPSGLSRFASSCKHHIAIAKSFTNSNRSGVCAPITSPGQPSARNANGSPKVSAGNQNAGTAGETAPFFLRCIKVAVYTVCTFYAISLWVVR